MTALNKIHEINRVSMFLCGRERVKYHSRYSDNRLLVEAIFDEEGNIEHLFKLNSSSQAEAKKLINELYWNMVVLGGFEFYGF